MGRSRSSFRTLLREAIILPLIFTFILSGLFIWQIQKLQQSSRLVSHSDHVIAKANILLRMQIDAQSSIRGYIITKEKKYLIPYEYNASIYNTYSEELLYLTSDDQEQNQLIAHTIGLTEKWFIYAEEVLRSISKGSHGADQITKVATYDLISQIRKNFEIIIDKEESLRNKRVQNDRKTVELATLICISAAALLGIIIFLYSRDIIRKLTTSFESNVRELEKSERRYERASVATRDLIWEWDQEKNAVIWNDAISTEYGYLPSTVENTVEWWTSKIHPDDYKEFFESIRRAVKDKSFNWMAEYRFARADGSYAEVLNRGVLEYNHDQISRVTGAMQDVTLTRSESKKRKEAEAIRDIFFNLPDLLLGVSDHNGYFTKLNESWEKTLGFTLEEILNRPWIEFVHPEDKELSLLERDHIYSGREKANIFVNRFKTKDGGYVWLHWVAEARGQETYFFATDITKLKMVEEEVESSREQLQLITNRIPDFIAYIDRELCYQFVNRAYESWLRRPYSDILGKPTKEVLDAQTFEKSYPHMLKVLEGEACRFENTIHDQDGALKYVDVEYVPDHDYKTGKVRGFILIAHDTTESKRTEKELKNALAIKDIFLSVASHELKTPLTTLQLQHQLAKRRAFLTDGSVDKEVVCKLLDHSEKSIGRLTRLIDDMLDVSRISTGKLKLRKEQFDLCELAREVMDRMQPLFLQEGIQGSTDCEGVIVGEWDRFRIEQVVSNLINNAIKYGGKSPVIIKVRKDEDSAYLSVVDHGPGISQEDQERIFQRFERAAEDASGLGLGLYICQEIISIHHGKILIESDVGKGASFIIKIPLHDGSQDN